MATPTQLAEAFVKVTAKDETKDGLSQVKKSVQDALSQLAAESNTGGGAKTLPSPFSIMGQYGFGGGGGGQIGQAASALEQITGAAMGLGSAIGIVTVGVKALNSELGHDLGFSVESVDHRVVIHTANMEKLNQAYRDFLSNVTHAGAERAAGHEDIAAGGTPDQMAAQGREARFRQANTGREVRELQAEHERMNERRKQLVEARSLDSPNYQTSSTVRKMAKEEEDIISKNIKDIEDQIQTKQRQARIEGEIAAKAESGHGRAAAETKAFIDSLKVEDTKQLRKKEHLEKAEDNANRIEERMNQRSIDRHSALQREKSRIEQEHEKQRREIILTTEGKRQEELLTQNDQMRDKHMKEAEKADEDRGKRLIRSLRAQITGTGAVENIRGDLESEIDRIKDQFGEGTPAAKEAEDLAIKGAKDRARKIEMATRHRPGGEFVGAEELSKKIQLEVMDSGQKRDQEEIRKNTHDAAVAMQQILAKWPPTPSLKD